MTAADYPEHLLARQSAPPFEGEGPFALWHFSEDPSLARFEPRAGHDPAGPLVWAVDTRHVAASTLEYSGSRLRNAAEAS